MRTITESEVYKKLKADLNKKKEKRLTLPLWLEVLLCVLPLIIVNVVVQHIVLERHINRNEISQYEVILKNAVAAFGSRLNHVEEGDVELSDILDGKSSMVIPISELSAGMNYEDADGNSAGTMYYRFYVYTNDGEILNCDPETGTVTAGDMLYDKEIEYIRAAAGSDDVLFKEFELDDWDYMAAFFSVKTSGKNVFYNGTKLTDAQDSGAAVVFCSLLDKDAVVGLRHGYVMQTTIFLTVGFMVMLAILAILLIRELSSLKLMQTTMDEIMDAESDGDEEEKNVMLIDRHFRESEIEDLVSVFNRMAGNIRVNLRRTRRLTEMFEPFVPEKLLKMFGKSDIRDVRVGDSMQIEGELVYIRFRDSVPQERRIMLMSGLSDALIDILQSYRGMILNFDSNTMIIIFPEEDQDEKTSEGLERVIEAYQSWIAGNDTDPGTVLCADHRVVSVKLLGNDERMQLYVCEEDLAPVRKLFRSAGDGEHGPLRVEKVE